MTPLRLRVRRAIERLDNPELRRARTLVKELRRGDVDVVYIGESSASFVYPDDHDHRDLSGMVAAELAPYRTVAIAGPGYLSDLLAAYLHLIEVAPRRPVVIHPLWVRGTYLPYVRNPIYERSRPGAAVRALDPQTPPWRIHGSFPRLRDFTEHERIPHPTLAGDDPVVADYTGPLRRGALDPDARRELLYNYHCAGRPSPEGLAAVEELGRAVHATGCRTVAYQTPVNVQELLRVLGERWRALHEENVAALDAAYRRGLGGDGDILPTAWMFGPEHFNQPWDASEHLNADGRLLMARTIADGVRGPAGRRVGGPASVEPSRVGA